MTTKIAYDLQVKYADTIWTAYSISKHILWVFYNTFNVADKKRLNFKIKDAFPEINRVVFCNYERPTIGETPFEILRNGIVNSKTMLFSWDATDGTLITKADRLCSPYTLRHTKRGNLENFISLSKINEKAATINQRKRNYASLETISAYAGLSIPTKPSLKYDSGKALVSKSVEDLIFYSANRTINTARILQTPFYQSTIETKADVIQSYNVKARLDDTDATLSSLVLTKNKTVSFQDQPTIDFQLSVDHHEINLLEHLRKNKIIPKAIYNFYSALQGTKYHNYKKVVHKNKVYIPYYDSNLQPVNSYATFSLGGNHGSYATDILDVPFNSEESTAIPKNQVQQFFNAYSIDIENCYPSMNVKLKVFENDQSHDYADMLQENLKIKHSLPNHKSEWSEEDFKNARKRQKLKRILNTATGAADRNDHNSILHLNNKTMSMRLMVNLIIYELGTTYVRQLGAKVISTNTDGIKIAFDSPVESSKVNEIAQQFNQRYQLQFSVKQIDRILVKDTNNEIEWRTVDHHDIVENINGRLGKGYRGKVNLDGNLDHPLIVDMAVVKYLSQHKNLKMTDARQWINDYLQSKVKDEKTFDGMQWALFIKPTAATSYQWNHQILTQANRFFFSVNGTPLHAFNQNGKEVKVRNWTSQQVESINIRYQINQIAKSIDLTPYLEWSLKILQQWQLSSSELTLTDTVEKTSVSKPKKAIKKHEPIKENTTNQEIHLKSKNSLLGQYLLKEGLIKDAQIK